MRVYDYSFSNQKIDDAVAAWDPKLGYKGLQVQFALRNPAVPRYVIARLADRTLQRLRKKGLAEPVPNTREWRKHEQTVVPSS